jgi:hypothetical protein
MRQLFDRLVADGTIPNKSTFYNRLSHQTAGLRAQNRFPDLLDGGHGAIYRRPSAESVESYLGKVAAGYTEDLTAGRTSSYGSGSKRKACTSN